jgi:16S rRNA (uracil1498-N3)-methyltransferase
MRRYWVPKEALQNGEVRLEGDVLHHIRDVCRQRQGAKFEVIVEGGRALLVEIISESRHESLAKILEERQLPEPQKPHIHLALSIPRFPVFEAVLEKSVELGVCSIRPFFSDFSFIRKQEDVFEKKRARFEKIVIGATQQSGRGDLMPIETPVAFDDLLLNFRSATNQPHGAAGLFAYEGSGVLAASEAMTQLKEGGPGEIWVFVGSEGGFSDREVQGFQSIGLKTVTLGSQVLRVETACVALVSIIKYDFDLMR